MVAVLKTAFEPAVEYVRDIRDWNRRMSRLENMIDRDRLVLLNLLCERVWTKEGEERRRQKTMVGEALRSAALYAGAECKDSGIERRELRREQVCPDDLDGLSRLEHGEFRYFAVHLGDFLDLMDEENDLGLFNTLRWLSCISPEFERNELKAFWEGVRDMRDYSGFFPDRRPPRGGRRTPREDRSFNPVLRPAPIALS